MLNPIPVIKSQVMQRISQAPAAKVWTPVDFLDLGSRDGVDKTLQRMVAGNDLRRIDRGLYDQPRVNTLTGQPAAPDYRSVIDAVGRRDQVRVLIDGMTAANDLGLTNAVPGQVIVHTDGRLRPIKLGNLVLQFKLTAPSKLYWAGHAAMRVVQALYWLRDDLKSGAQVDQGAIQAKLIRLLQDSRQGSAIRDDLRSGLHTVPSWMQRWIRELLARSEQAPAEVRA
ncbi:MAG: hypothetical protein A2Z44_01365 [Betaproteobacteria bacterium RBG_19FT_COMBO_58_11]|nr:MAG: hypothetical protein A2Z44_01365 [Betaproteobacteria bacterium RBG_19FT_COMBO_58_11]OGT04309.1 MAG: hypothetical protein A2143_03520 [Gallionellales bacterium RBG_16_57_15]